MRVTAESRRIRLLGLLVIWFTAGLLLYVHAAAVRDYLDRLDALALRGVASASTPLRRTIPGAYADAQLWVRNALALGDGGGPQIRYTHADNAPYGREVHWHSGLAWAIGGAGAVRRLFTGEPWPRAIEQSLVWFNLPVLLALVAFFSGWVARRAGLGAAAALAFMMVGNPDFYAGFSPGYVDHHGLLAAAVLGVVLGVGFMGVGFFSRRGGGALLPGSPATAKAGAVLSALSGGLGMWVSAATLIPALALTGAAAAAVILRFGRDATEFEMEFQPALWRLWGGLGAGVSVALYLLEYAPGHLGWRLEVNHPVYALAWWGGAELIAQIGEWRCRLPRAHRRNPAWLGGAMAALAIPAVAIALGGAHVFVVFDPFVARLSSHVSEGLSLAKTIEVFGWASVLPKLPWAIALVVFSGVLLWRCRAADRVLALFAILVTAAFVAMGVAQTRWWPSAAAAEISLILVALAALTVRKQPPQVAAAMAKPGAPGPKADRGNAAAWLWIAALVLAVCAPATIGRIVAQQSANRHGMIDPIDAIQPLYRDIAATIRASRATGDVVLLATPNASAGIAYYGGLTSIGTLYWENVEGTKAAAKMFSAEDESEARRLIRSRSVTHVVMISDTNFLGDYFELEHPGAKQEDFENSFGYQLLAGGQPPLWLERVPYEIPRDVAAPGLRVAVYATRFNAPAAEAAYDTAVADIGAQRLAVGEQELDHALALAPRAAEFWVIKAHLCLARNDVPAAIRAVGDAVGSASAGQVVAVCTAEGFRLYQAGAHAAAVALFRRALATAPSAVIANNLVWILATSPDDRVRNGADALALSQQIAGGDADYLSLSGRAAALAECGRYAEAVEYARRAAAVARTSRSPALVRKAEACLAAYGSDRPWRE